MSLVHPNLVRIVEEDLYHELRFLLVSATNWAIADAANRGVTGAPQERSLPSHLVVMSMDSAFLHARNLYEFFTTKRRDALRLRTTRATWLTFNAARQHSSLFATWRPALHERLVHVSINRPRPVTPHGQPLAATAVNLQVLNFANDVLSLWRRFEIDPSVVALQTSIESARSRAIAEADATSRRLNQTPIPF